jgi:hypothetical protein
MQTFLLAATLLAAAATSQATCTFTNFGRPCGGDLAGSVVRGPAGAVVVMDVANATPNAFCFLTVGPLAATPITLPGSACLLLVQPRAYLFGQTDRAGSAGFRINLPRITPLVVEFQAVTAEPTRGGRVVESTNGVQMACR